MAVPLYRIIAKRRIAAGIRSRLPEEVLYIQCDTVICIQVQRLALYVKLLLILIQFAGEVETRLDDLLDDLEARRSG